MKQYRNNIATFFSIVTLVIVSGGICTAIADTGQGSKKPQVQNGQNAGGQRLCLTTSGELRTRGRCKTSRGEVQIDSSNLATISDISFTGIPAGETVFGVVGGDFDSAALNSTWGTVSSLPAQVGPALTSPDVIIAASAELLSACGGTASNCLSAEEVSSASLCTGSTAAPSAPEGKLCIYPTSVVNASSLAATPAEGTAGAATGFQVNWTAAALGDTQFAGVFAYTAPDTE
jgi:hypothetical protein